MNDGRRRLGGYALLIPVTLFLALVFFVPLVQMLLRGFTDPEPGLQNFAWFFSQDANITVLIRTFTTAFVVAVMCVIAGYPFAVLMSFADPKWRALLILIVLIPLATSSVIRTFAWVILLGNQGPVAALSQGIGLGEATLLRTNVAVVIGMAQVLLPFAILPMYSAISKVDTTLLLASAGLGSKPFATFRTVYLPLTAPGIGAGFLLTFVLSLGFYITPAMLGSPNETLLSSLIQLQITSILDWGRAAVMALVLLVSTLLVLVAVGLPTSRKMAAMRAGKRVAE